MVCQGLEDPFQEGLTHMTVSWGSDGASVHFHVDLSISAGLTHSKVPDLQRQVFQKTKSEAMAETILPSIICLQSQMFTLLLYAGTRYSYKSLLRLKGGT